MASKPKSDSDPRNTLIAWLSPALARSFYFQPIFREFTKLFPNTVIFTGRWAGFLPGYEGTFAVRLVQGLKYVKFKTTSTGEIEGFTWIPISIFWTLLKFHPTVIFSSAFSIWSFVAVAIKMFTGCRVIMMWDGISPSNMFLDRPLRRKLRKLMGSFFDVSLCNTREGMKYLQDVLGMPESKLVHYPYLIPEADALLLGNSSHALRLEPRPVFLFVGRIEKFKGWRQLLEAVKYLRQQARNPFSVILVGSGPDIEEVRQFISCNDLTSIVHLAGAVSYDCLGAYFEHADVFVLPSLEDVWGTVVVEGMLFGKPILCSKYAGAKEVVQHDVNGFIFDPYNAEQLASYMGRFISEPDLIKRFGAKSSEMIASYSPERAAAVLESLALNLAPREPVEIRVRSVEDRESPSIQRPGQT